MLVQIGPVLSFTGQQGSRHRAESFVSFLSMAGVLLLTVCVCPGLGRASVEAAQVMRILSINKLAVDELQRARLGAEAFNFLFGAVCSNLEEEGRGV